MRSVPKPSPWSTIRHKIRFVLKEFRGVHAYDPKRHRTRLAGPISVQIQTIDRCNAACPMCLYASTSNDGSPQVIDPQLYGSLLRQLAACGTVRILCLMLQNEPLLDRDLHRRFRSAREVLGSSVRLVVMTHGALLTRRRADELIEAGVDQISVSIDAERPETYEKVRPGLDFDAVVANTEALLERQTGPEVVVGFVPQRDNEDEVDDFNQRWRSRGATVSVDRLANRGGALDAFERLRVERSGAARRLIEGVLNRLVPCCPLPFTSAPILSDGCLITCCNDWEPREVLADLNEVPLSVAWNGEHIGRNRHLLYRRRWRDSRVCCDCSLAGGFWNWSPKRD